VVDLGRDRRLDPVGDVARDEALEHEPYIVDLVDVVPGPRTDPAVIEEARQLVLGLGQVRVAQQLDAGEVRLGEVAEDRDAQRQAVDDRVVDLAGCRARGPIRR
jgi:3-hydroxyacyl-CoA dehydrogenase